MPKTLKRSPNNLASEISSITKEFENRRIVLFSKQIRLYATLWRKIADKVNAVSASNY